LDKLIAVFLYYLPQPGENSSHLQLLPSALADGKRIDTKPRL